MKWNWEGREKAYLAMLLIQANEQELSTSDNFCIILPTSYFSKEEPEHCFV